LFSLHSFLPDNKSVGVLKEDQPLAIVLRDPLVNGPRLVQEHVNVA